ncbi:hypothetical protein ACFWGW_32750, partial [Streptomyces rochei]
TYTTVLDIARNPNAASRGFAMHVLGDRWPDREDTYTTVLDTARNPNTNEFDRSVAVRVLAERWPDREDTYTTVLDTARNPNTNDDTRTAAVRVLAERWPESEGAWNCAAAIATEEGRPEDDFSVPLLALVWPERRETEELLLQLAEKAPSAMVTEALTYIAETKRHQSPKVTY